MVRPKKEQITKEPIKVRFKALNNGVRSVYFDIYSEGKRSYEFLKLYLVPEVDAESRKKNASTMQAVNAIKAQRVLDMMNEKAGIRTKGRGDNITLGSLLEAFKAKRIKQGHKGSARSINNALLFLKKNRMDNIKLKSIDKQWCVRFVEALKSDKSNLKPSSQLTYYEAVGAAFNDAERCDLIVSNPMYKIDKADKIKGGTEEREFLTRDEVVKLINTPCKYDNVKSAFLFSCFCGLRKGDIGALRWGNIHKDGNRYSLRIRMQKTGNELILPLNDEALRWLPKRPLTAADGDKVFRPIDHCYAWAQLKQWVADAGINKRISFHCARHTFATMLITLGADLYTVSKLLGHSDIKVTQIYARLVDSKKVEAVELFNGKFD